MSPLSDNEILNQYFNAAAIASASELLAVSTSVVTLTAANYGVANTATVQIQDDEIRFWVDGSTPTSTSGFIASKNDTIELNTHSEIVNFKAIRSSGSSVTAHLAASYFE